MTEQTFRNYLKELTKETRNNENLRKLLAKNIIPENILNEMRNEMIEVAKQGFSGSKVEIENIISDSYKNDLNWINSNARKNLLYDVEMLLKLKFTGINFKIERKEKTDYICFWWA